MVESKKILALYAILNCKLWPSFEIFNTYIKATT